MVFAHITLESFLFGLWNAVCRSVFRSQLPLVIFLGFFSSTLWMHKEIAHTLAEVVIEFWHTPQPHYLLRKELCMQYLHCCIRIHAKTKLQPFGGKERFVRFGHDVFNVFNTGPPTVASARAGSSIHVGDASVESDERVICVSSFKVSFEVLGELLSTDRKEQ